MSTRLSYRVVTSFALIVSALALSASAGAVVRPSASPTSPAWMRHVGLMRTAAPVGGALSEAELPGASNPSEPYAAASQSEMTTRCEGCGNPWLGSLNRGVSGGVGALVTTVNPVTGDLSLSLGDLFMPERGVPLGLSLTYNSYFASADGPFGHGWSFNTGMSLKRAADGTVTISQENGSQVTFRPKGTGYGAAPRVIASLRHAGNTFVFIRGTRSQTCPRYSRSCVTFIFNEPVGFRPARLLQVASPDGGLTLTYNPAGKLVTVRDPAGRQLTFAYAKGKVSTVLSQANGYGIHNRYDTNGNLSSFTNAGGDSYRFVYDADHLLTRIVDPRGAETHIAYDAGGAVQSITDPLGDTDFSRSAGQASVTHPGGAISTVHFAAGEVTRVDEGNSSGPLATTLITYDPATLGPTAVTNPDGQTSHMTYDALGHLTSFTDPLGHKSTYQFDATARTITATDPLGMVSRAKTDASGRLLTVRLDVSDPALTQTTTFHYGSAAHPGDITSVTDAEGHLWKFAYDKFGDQTRFTDPLGDTSTTSFDRMGRPTVNTALNNPATGAAPPPTTFTYDPEGRLVRATDPVGNTESFSYDADGNLIAGVAGGHQTTYGYDAAGRWTVMTRPNGSHATLSYLANGHIGEVCDDGNACEEYTYDALGNPATFTDSSGNTSSFLYSAAGVLLSSTDGNGVTTSYSHNADGQTTGVSYSDGITHPVVADFDADGRMTHMTDATGSTTFTHDPLGNLTDTSGPNGDVSYVYDHKDNVKSISLNSVEVAAQTYDAAGRLVQLRDRLGNATAFSYDPAGNLTQTLFPGGDVDRDGYDAANRMVSFSHSDGAALPPSLSILYHRNPLGQVTGTTETGTGQTDQAYTYDANGRLASVNGSPVSYDSRNNLLNDGYHNNFGYDASDRLVSGQTTSGGSTLDWLYGYDANGSRTSASTTDGTQSLSYGWDAAGNLASFADASTSETNTYDGLGRKVLLHNGSNTVTSVWGSTHATPRLWGGGPTDPPDKDCGGGIYCVLARITKPGMDKLQPAIPRLAPPSGPVAIGGTVYLYGPDGLPVEQLDSSNQALFYHHDQLGSTRALTDSTGHTVAVMSYDAFGRQTYNSGTVSVPFGFGGGLSDPVSRLVMFGGSNYDPATGQFVSRPGGYFENGDIPTGDDFETGDKPTAAQFGDLIDSASQRSFTPDLPGTYQVEVCSTDSRPSFTPDLPGTYQFSLIVVSPCGSNRPVIAGAALLGTSPYALGGGDPINAEANCVSNSDHTVTICGNHKAVTRSNISNN